MPGRQGERGEVLTAVRLGAKEPGDWDCGLSDGSGVSSRLLTADCMPGGFGVWRMDGSCRSVSISSSLRGERKGRPGHGAAPVRVRPLEPAGSEARTECSQAVRRSQEDVTMACQGSF